MKIPNLIEHIGLKKALLSKALLFGGCGHRVASGVRSFPAGLRPTRSHGRY